MDTVFINTTVGVETALAVSNLVRSLPPVFTAFSKSSRSEATDIVVLALGPIKLFCMNDPTKPPVTANNAMISQVDFFMMLNLTQN